jgi:hypothetical protein
MRYRDDSITAAEIKRDAVAGKPVYQCREAWCLANPADRCPYHPEVWVPVPPAMPGDTWRLTWHPGADAPEGADGPLAGYAICCPLCLEVHYWSSADNCASKRPYTITGTDGKDYQGWTCDHIEARTSCWTWTGSAEGGTLSAYASLYARKACGWHGWLDTGVLRL